MSLGSTARKFPAALAPATRSVDTCASSNKAVARPSCCTVDKVKVPPFADRYRVKQELRRQLCALLR